MREEKPQEEESHTLGGSAGGGRRFGTLGAVVNRDKYVEVSFDSRRERANHIDNNDMEGRSGDRMLCQNQGLGPV